MPPNEVPISIDKKHLKSLSPTTGSALYTLGTVADGYDLWRETKGPGDDELIAKDNPSITLHAGDHFYTAQSTLNPGSRGNT
jgi:hypothetical protein